MLFLQLQNDPPPPSTRFLGASSAGWIKTFEKPDLETWAVQRPPNPAGVASRILPNSKNQSNFGNNLEFWPKFMAQPWEKYRILCKACLDGNAESLFRSTCHWRVASATHFFQKTWIFVDNSTFGSRYKFEHATKRYNICCFGLFLVFEKVFAQLAERWPPPLGVICLRNRVLLLQKKQKNAFP